MYVCYTISICASHGVSSVLIAVSATGFLFSVRSDSPHVSCVGIRGWHTRPRMALLDDLMMTWNVIYSLLCNQFTWGGFCTYVSRGKYTIAGGIWTINLLWMSIFCLRSTKTELVYSGWKSYSSPWIVRKRGSSSKWDLHGNYWETGITSTYIFVQYGIPIHSSTLILRFPQGRGPSSLPASSPALHSDAWWPIYRILRRTPCPRIVEGWLATLNIP